MAIPVSEIVDGAWTARWNRHVVHIVQRSDGWRATLWAWPEGRSRTQLAVFEGCATAVVAVNLACDVLLTHGARAFVDGAFHNIASFLAFTPAPDAVA